MLEHTPLTTSSFQGLYSRSDETKVPFDHLRDCLNLRFKDGQFETREGSVLDITFPQVKRMRIYKKSNEAPRYLLLDNAGNLFDATVSTTAPILTIPGMTDFNIAVVNDRCYITPHNGLVGLAGQFVHMYDGSGPARKAGGTPVSAAPTVNTGASGKVEAGIHLFAVAFETSSGFITTFGPVTLHDCPGSTKLDISGIPIGPAGTVARHLVATKAVSEYNGDPDSQEFFFVPQGNLSNNTATTLTVDFYDADLFATCDYLLEQLKEIPAGVAIIPYNGRLCVIATNLHPDTVLVSKRNEPESFNEIEGYFTKEDSQVNFRNGFEFRGLGYFGKSDRWYAVKDNGDNAITWDIMDVDMAVGCESHSVASVLDKEGKNIFDGVFIADRTGLYFFNGSFSGKPLSWKIEQEWEKINKAAFHNVDICIDPVIGCGYIVLPTHEGNNSANTLWYFDFSKNISPEDVRWCRWAMGNTPEYYNSVVTEVNNINKETRLKIGGYNVWGFSETTRLDGNNTIEVRASFAHVGTGESGAVNHFTGFRLRAVGDGSVNVSALSLSDGIHQIYAPPIVLKPREEGFKDRIFNIVTERLSVALHQNTASAWIRVTEFTLLSKVMWEMRPNP